MDTLTFLRLVWPDNAVGHYCLATPFQKAGMSKPAYRHYVRDTIEQAAAVAEQLRDTADVYFCMHKLKSRGFVIDGKKNLVIRSHANMRECRTLFGEIDCGEGKPYATRAEAIAALKAFCKAVGLPRPMIVASGGGIHFYWIVEHAITTEAWKAAAEQLCALEAHYKLGNDTSRTTDQSSVLRVVGTFNFKRGEKRPIVCLMEGAITPSLDLLKLLEEAVIRAGVVVNSPAAPKAASEFGDNTSRDFSHEPPVTLREVVAICPQLQRVLRSRGAGESEPQWRAMLGLVKKLERGDEAIHLISSGHDDYTREMCIAKAESVAGPTRCETIQSAMQTHPERAAICEGCRFKGQSSPIAHARKKAVVTPPKVESARDAEAVRELPPGYAIRKKNGLVVLTTNSKGEPFDKSILPYGLWVLRTQWDREAAATQLVCRVEHEHEAPLDFTVSAELLSDERGLHSRLLKNNIFPANMAEMRNYMSAYVRFLQSKMASEEQHGHLGWTAKKDKFILPDATMSLDGTTSRSSLSAEARIHTAAIKKSGTLKRQVELLEFFNKPEYLPQQFYILCSLSAPTFYMTDYYGVIVNASGETGASKSTTQEVAASLYGSPPEYVLNGGKKGGTALYIDARMHTLANLPVCVDEITQISPADAQTLALGVSQLGGREGNKRDGTPRDKPTVGVKATVMLTTANTSLHSLLSIDNVSGTAASMRVLELNFPKRRDSPENKRIAHEFLCEIRENYGHIGPAHIANILPFLEDMKFSIKGRVADLDRRTNADPGERFWTATAANAFENGRRAKTKGLIPFDIDLIDDWFVRVAMPQSRGAIVGEYSTPCGTLVEYLMSNIDHILLANGAGFDGKPNITNQIRGKLVARHEVKSKVMWVSHAAFKAHCQRTGGNATMLLNKLAETGVVTAMRQRITLGKGSEHDTGQVSAFCVDLSHQEIAETAPSVASAGDNVVPIKNRSVENDLQRPTIKPDHRRDV